VEKFKTIAKKSISKLPRTTGVYCFINQKLKISPPTKIWGGQENQKFVYIGKAINIKNRVKNHFQQPSYRDNLFINSVNKVGFFETGSEIEALILEAKLIKKYQPKYNIMWRDDKSYFYVCVQNNKLGVPYVAITHQIKNQRLDIKNQNLGVASRQIYIGPFTERAALKKALKFLRKVLPYYTSAKHPKVKCAWCHLDLCPGPYLNLSEYKKNIKKLTLILRGKKCRALSSLRQEMKQLSKEKKFEEAGKIRDRIFALEQIMSHAHVINSDNKGDNGFLPQGKKPYSVVLHILQKIIDTKTQINRIETYDVSNIQGKQAAGSMVVFKNGKPDKNQYRKFRIKMKNEPNDIAMLKEVLQRRFNHSEWEWPDAILIDGGKAQLNAAIKVKEQFHRIVPLVISLAKGRQELFVEGRKKPIPLKSLPQKVYNLIKHLDDEAHRFAITYHKTLRKKNLLE